MEEACKYFGYRIVHHPDFVSERDLQKGSAVQSEGKPKMTDLWGGGLGCISANEESGEFKSFDDDDEGNRDSDRPRAMRNLNLLEFKAVELPECPPRTRQSVALAITIAMVSVVL